MSRSQCDIVLSTIDINANGCTVCPFFELILYTCHNSCRGSHPKPEGLYFQFNVHNNGGQVTQ